MDRYDGSCLAPSISIEEERRLNAVDRELALVVPIFTLIREACAELAKLAPMIREPACLSSAEELLAYAAQEFEIIKNAIIKSHS